MTTAWQPPGGVGHRGQERVSAAPHRNATRREIASSCASRTSLCDCLRDVAECRCTVFPTVTITGGETTVPPFVTEVLLSGSAREECIQGRIDQQAGRDRARNVWLSLEELFGCFSLGGKFGISHAAIAEFVSRPAPGRLKIWNNAE